MYSGLDGKKFDTVVANPPYDFDYFMSQTATKGGADGEGLTKRVITGLPYYLCPGGKAYVLSMISDREEETAEQRVRHWLGEHSGEFDVAVLSAGELDSNLYALEAVTARGGSINDVARHLEQFREDGVKKLAIAAIHFIRHRSPREAVTVRRLAGVSPKNETLEWLLEWEHTKADLDYLALKPVPSPTLNVLTRHEIRERELVPVEYRIVNTDPLKVDTPCPAWVAFLISICDGEKNGRELYEQLKDRAFLSEASFSETMRSLGSAGVLRFPNSREAE
jgi:hypothetical protein